MVHDARWSGSRRSKSPIVTLLLGAVALMLALAPIVFLFWLSVPSTGNTAVEDHKVSCAASGSGCFSGRNTGLMLAGFGRGLVP
jgi:hypothetical protein